MGDKKNTEIAAPIEILPIDEYKVLSPVQLLSRKTAIKQIQKAVMIKDIHFGILPGTEKPTLYKAGADELTGTFNIGREDPKVEDLSTEDEIRYRVTIRLFSRISGRFLGAGIGECSSNEEKYRWRKPVCTQEWEETAEDRRREKWVKVGWDPKKKENIGKKIKQVRTNPSDIANTILKMGDKRGYVHATISVLGISDLFEQDLEDLEENTRDHILAEERTKGGKPEVKAPEQKTEETAAATNAPSASEPGKTPEGESGEPILNEETVISEGQLRIIKKKVEEKRDLTLEDIEKEFKVKTINDIKLAEMNKVLLFISKYEDKLAKTAKK